MNWTANRPAAHGACVEESIKQWYSSDATRAISHLGDVQAKTLSANVVAPLLEEGSSLIKLDRRLHDARTRWLLFVAEILLSEKLIFVPVCFVFILVLVVALNLPDSFFTVRESAVKQSVYSELVDWHTSGPFMCKCAIAWLRVRNNNSREIKNFTFAYTTYDQNGKPLNQGQHKIDETVRPGEVKNFFEQYLGFVDSNSSKLGVNLIDVESCAN